MHSGHIPEHTDLLLQVLSRPFGEEPDFAVLPL